MLRLLVPLIFVLLAPLNLLAQGLGSVPGSGNTSGSGSPGPGSGETLLEVGINDGNGYQYSAPDLAAAPMTLDIKLRLTSPKKTWCTVLPYCFVVADATTTGPNGYTTQDIINAFPWMAEPTPTDPATLYPAWTGQPDLLVDPSLAWWFLFHGAYDPFTGLPSENAVRDLFVPILEDLANPTAEHNTRTWSAEPLSWVMDVTGRGIGPFMSQMWTGALYEYGGTPEPDVFSTEGIARLAIQLQAPTPADASIFMNSPMFTDAASLGLYLNLQSVNAVDPDPGVLPGTDDLTAPGLGLPALPDVSFSPPITMTVAIAAPLSGSGTINPIAPTTLERTSTIRRKLRSVFPSSTMNFNGGATAAITWDGDLHHPLRHRITIPNAAVTGDIFIQTPFSQPQLLWQNVLVLNLAHP